MILLLNLTASFRAIYVNGDNYLDLLAIMSSVIQRPMQTECVRQGKYYIFLFYMTNDGAKPYEREKHKC